MNGINIVIPGSGNSFEALNLGNINPDKRFISAAGITNSAQKTGISNLYSSLLSGGLWDKLDAIYPFVGDNVSAHKYNLKNPLDTDAAYRLTFENDVTAAHTVAGFIGNGTNRSANTHYVQTNFDVFHISVFNSTAENQTPARSLAGVGRTGTTPYIMNMGRVIGNSPGYTSMNFGLAAASPLDITSYDKTKTGLLTALRTGATDERMYDQGVLLGSKSGARVADPTGSNPVTIGCFLGTTGAKTAYFQSTIAFACIGQVALSDVEVANLSTMVTAFQAAVR